MHASFGQLGNKKRHTHANFYDSTRVHLQVVLFELNWKSEIILELLQTKLLRNFVGRSFISGHLQIA